MAERDRNLYVDDSGTKEYRQDAIYSSHAGPTPYFVFGGLLLPPSEAGRIAAGLRKLKWFHLGTDAIEIKANWLKRPREREARYLRPLAIDEETIGAFVQAVYDLILRSDCELIAAIVHKAEVQAMYARPWYAPAIAYECLLQRAHLAATESGGFLHVTVDDMSGATPKGNQYKSNLVSHHLRLQKFGSQLLPGKPMGMLAGLRFSDSRADERLQLADLVAYAVYRQFVDHGDKWDAEGASLPLYRYFGILASKFRRGPGGSFSGYGVIKFPRKTWRRWGVQEEP